MAKIAFVQKLALDITALAALAVIFGGGAATAQSFNEAGICSRLLERQQSGLYFVEDGFAEPVIQRVDAAPLPYTSRARFYYLPLVRAGGRDTGRQWVWHIRTQTEAGAAPRANLAYVYRPGRRTACSPTRELFEFSPDDRFVELNRYIDYHNSSSGRARETGLRDYFHFEFRDDGRCVRTDAAEYGNLEGHYGFEGLSRQQEALERRLTPTGTAYAATGVSRFAGLSSEFSYQDQPGPACLSFTAPLPTRAGNSLNYFWGGRYQEALAAAQKWQPVQTLVVIKRVTARGIVEVMRRTISWRPRS